MVIFSTNLWLIWQSLRILLIESYPSLQLLLYPQTLMRRWIVKKSTLWPVYGVPNARVSIAPPKFWPRIAGLSLWEISMLTICRFAVFTENTRRLFVIRNVYRAVWNVLAVGVMKERPSESVDGKMNADKMSTIASCKRRCLQKLAVIWRKKWEVKDQPSVDNSKVISWTPQRPRNSSRFLSNRSITKPRPSPINLLLHSNPIKMEVIFKWLENKLLQSTSSWIHHKICSCKACNKCNPTNSPSSTVNWRFSSIQTRTIILRQRMRSRSSKPPLSRPNQPSECSMIQPFPAVISMLTGFNAHRHSSSRCSTATRFSSETAVKSYLEPYKVT